MSENWEQQINALLDGELDEQEAAALRQEAEGNEALARAIVEAYGLQAKLDELDIEPAPASLRARLARIPKTESADRKRWFGMPKWIPVGAMAAVPLAVIAMVMMTSGPEPSAPGQPEFTQEEILQAQEDVRIAFAYLDRISGRAGLQMQQQIAKELSSGVNDNVAEHMPFTSHSEQEEKS